LIHGRFREDDPPMRAPLSATPGSAITLLLLSLGIPLTHGATHAGAWIEYGTLIGHTGPTDTRIWLKSSGAAVVSVRVGENEDLSNSRLVEGPELQADTDYAGHVLVTGLEPSRRYFYSVLLDRQPAMVRPYPSFRTAPAPGESGRIRFAFTSCLGRDGFLPGAGWADMARANVDLVLLLGDNHYADTTDPAGLRKAYYDHRRYGAWQDMARRTPIYSIWDDHDYGPNDSDRTAEGKERSLVTFKAFWANPGYGEPDNPGIYYRFSRGDVDFFMLDVRYHRDPNSATNLVNKTMLGVRQLAWLKRELLASRAAVKFIASGSEWQSHGHRDSWTSFSRERQEIFDFIRARQISGVILLSGDRHFTGAYQILGRLIEVTSGPMGARNFPTKNLPEMFLNHGEGKLYSVFDVDTTVKPTRVALEVYRAGDGLVQTREFTWDEIEGRTRIEPLPRPLTNHVATPRISPGGT
jgi:alkaline phosphatase D